MRALKIVTLYVSLVLVSACVISLTLGTNPLSAAATASVGCIFKTIAATLHGHIWERILNNVESRAC